jgi:hypothetical protein
LVHFLVVRVLPMYGDAGGGLTFPLLLAALALLLFDFAGKYTSPPVFVGMQL